MRMAWLLSLPVATIPPIFAYLKTLEIIGDTRIAFWFAILAALEFYVIARRIYEIANTQETELLISIYQKTYKRSIRFVPAISFLVVSIIALYTLAPIVILILLPAIALHSGNITYSVSTPFFSDKKKEFLEGFRTFIGAIIVAIAGPVYAANDGIRAEFYYRYESIEALLKNYAAYGSKYLHDAFVSYSPMATLIAALIAITARAGLKAGIGVSAVILVTLKFLPPSIYHLAITGFVFLVALYERMSMNISHSLIVPDVGSLSRIVPLGFTIVMTFIGGSLEPYIKISLVRAPFISLLTLLSLGLGLVLVRYLLKLPTISGMRIGVLRL